MGAHLRAWCRALPLALAIGLAACATSYQPTGLTGGYEEIKLSQDTYRITVSGNAYTTRSRAENIALLRAAELTIRDGFERFVVLSGNVAPQYAGTTPVTVSRFGGTVVASGGDAIVKPGGDLIIRTVARADPAYATALDARLIDSQLRPRLVQQ